jgi:hypothetical protein
MSIRVNFRIIPTEGAGAASGDAAEPIALLTSLRKQDPSIKNVAPANELLKAKNNELIRIKNDAAIKLKDEERTKLDADRDAKLARLRQKLKARGAVGHLPATQETSVTSSNEEAKRLATKDINLDSTAAVSDYTDEQAGKKETAGLAAAATTLKNTKGGKVADKFEARKSPRSPKRTGSSAKSLPKKDPAMKARAPVNFTNEQDLKQKETQEVKAAAVLKKEGLAKDNAADDATEMEAMDEKAKTKGGEAAKKRVANAEDKKRKVDSDARKKAAKDEEAKNKTENTAMKRAAIEESKKKRADADAIKKAAKEDQIKKKAEEVAKSGERWEAEAKEEKARWAAEAGVKKIDLEAAATVEAEKIKRWTADAEAKNTEEEARAAAEVAQKKRWAAEAILEKKQWAEQSTKKQEGEEA